MKKIRINDLVGGRGQVKYNKGLIVIRACPIIDFIVPDQKKVKARVPEIKIIKPHEEYPIQITADYTAVTKPLQLYSFLFIPTLDPGYSDKDLFFLFENSFTIDDADVVGSLGKSLDFAVIMENLTERYSDPFSILPTSGVNCRYLKIYHCAAGKLEETINLLCKEIPCNKYCIEPFSNKTYHFKTTHEKIAEFSKKIAENF